MALEVPAALPGLACRDLAFLMITMAINRELIGLVMIMSDSTVVNCNRLNFNLIGKIKPTNKRTNETT